MVIVQARDVDGSRQCGRVGVTRRLAIRLAVRLAIS